MHVCGTLNSLFIYYIIYIGVSVCIHACVCVYRVCGAKLYKKYQNLGTGMQLVCWGAGVEVTRGQTVMRA